MRLVVLAVIAVGLGFACRDVAKRIAILNAPPIGPPDWSAILTSPTLMKVAWQLSSNPHAVGRTRLLGAMPGSAEISLAHPFQYENGRLRLELVIKNTTAHEIIVPPFCSGGRISKPRSPGWAHVGSSARPWLGRGVQVLAPGQTARIRCSFKAQSDPVNFFVGVHAAREYHEFSIYKWWYWLCDDWSEMPEPELTRTKPHDPWRCKACNTRWKPGRRPPLPQARP